MDVVDPILGHGCWPTKYYELGTSGTMKQDAQCLVNKCEKCQKHATLIHQPIEPLNVMLSPCPFSQWKMDIVGSFPLAPEQRKFLLIAINYFT
ncbi:UNVERIFIED_CONTAM: hypothetical protein Slati_2204500, partial [Sesamum latifolium]